MINLRNFFRRIIFQDNFSPQKVLLSEETKALEIRDAKRYLQKMLNRQNEYDLSLSSIYRVISDRSKRLNLNPQDILKDSSNPWISENLRRAFVQYKILQLIIREYKSQIINMEDAYIISRKLGKFPNLPPLIWAIESTEEDLQKKINISLDEYMENLNSDIIRDFLFSLKIESDTIEEVLKYISFSLEDIFREIEIIVGRNSKDRDFSEESIEENHLDIDIISQTDDSGESWKVESMQNNKVFIVHGRNHDVRNRIDLFIRDLGLQTIVMDGNAQGGRTLPEKFEDLANECGFAVFILSADDNLFDQDNNKPIKRARQNVILEIGYFWGVLGRHGRVVFLVEADPDMDLPSDIRGIGYIPITDDLGTTCLGLHKELTSAGLLRG